MNEALKITITLLSVLIPCISTITGLIIKNVNNAKAKKIAKEINFYSEQASKYVAEAEKKLNYTGNEKKEFVETKINQECIANKVRFDAEKVSNIIENIVALTKEVNQREKDKKEDIKELA